MSSGEPSILEYARFYGLAQNHLEIDPLQGLRESPDVELRLDDNPDLFQIRHDCVKVPRERLVINTDAVSLLQEVTSQAKLPLDPEIDVHRAKRLKVEVPLLRSDPEIDLLRFAPTIVPDLENEFLPEETIDEEADEGLTWPSIYHKLPEEYNKKFSSEKLEVKSDTLLFLQDCLNGTGGGGHHATLDEVGASYEKKTKVPRLLSPVLPMSPDILPYTPSSDTGRLELLTDTSSPTKAEQLDLERRLFDKDAITSTAKQARASSHNSNEMLLGSESLSDIYSPLKGAAHPPLSPSIHRRSLNARKMEEPISPPGSEQRPPWERKSVTWALTDVIADPLEAFPRPENVSSDDIDAFFDASIRPIAIKAEREIEQEQLQEADTTRRVPVPVMDFSLPVAPWNASTEISKNRDAKPPYKETLQEMKRVHLSKHVWPMSGKVERELRWTPFPAALGKVETQESIAGDDFIEKYLTQPDRVNVDTLTWKPEGLRIFDDLATSEEEVLEEGTFPEERDMTSLLTKRKFELESDEDGLRPSIHEPTLRVSRSDLGPKSLLQENQGSRPTHFSALDALSSYVNVRQGIAEIPKQLIPGDDTSGSSAKLQEEPTAKVEQRQPGLPKHLHNQQTGKASNLLPVITVASASTPFVVSASVLNDRKLTRQIQKLFPSAEFFERDFDLYCHSDKRSTPLNLSSEIRRATSTIADEADIILSPSTGLIWTTLQKIKQRSLPGQKARSAIRERIMCAAPRYERLVILVSAASHGEIDTALGAGVDAVLDASDCEAMIELTTFCMSVHPDIELTFIAGGEDSLARWIVVMMVKHGISDSDIKLIQDETLWEVFLRRAGLNAFAAQVILGSLKIPDQSERQPVHEGGLAVFVRMSTDERFARFETLLGGRRLLTRVSRALDGHW